MTISLVTYANRYFVRQQRRLIRSARKHGINDLMPFQEHDLKSTQFYLNNREILDNPRGAGFCAWKPYFIKQALEKLDESDVLFYIDGGVEVIAPIRALVKIARAGEGVTLFNNNEFANSAWTKRDCFVGMKCDEEKFWSAAQVNGAFQIFRNTPFARHFLDEWLNYCSMPEVVTDAPNIRGLPNFPDFKDHRYDQSILTNLGVKYKLPVFRDPSQWGNYAKMEDFREAGEWLSQPYLHRPLLNSPYATLFNHHRDIGWRLKLKRKWKGGVRRLRGVFEKRLGWSNV